MDELNKIKEICNILDSLEEATENLPNAESEVDKKISDLYHFIENNKMDAKMCYRMIKELKEVLSERRNLKYKQTILYSFRNNIDRLNLKTNRSMLLADVNKKLKDVQKEYKNRIYDEEELRKKIEE